jgi:glycosyltransferase involved in cell wall biosynthesis
MRVAILACSAPGGDAVGNQVAEKLSFFLDRGAAARVFLDTARRVHPAVRPYLGNLDPLCPQGVDWEFLQSADLVIVEFSQTSPLGNLLPMLAGGNRRILFDYHGVTPPQLWATHREALEGGTRQRGLAWFADTVVTHSQFTRRELVDATGIDSRRCQVLGLPIDAEHLTPGKAVRSLRDQLGLTDAHLILFVGRAAPNKRLPILVEALGRLRERTPAVHAAFIGDTTDLYQEEKRRCQQLASERGVADRVHFLGQVDDEHLRDAYRSADVLVLPSRHEGFGIPVLEAMACGLPVVAARAGALPETVGAAGLTFHPDDPDDLARQLRRVLDSANVPDVPLDPGRRRRIAVVAYRFGSRFVGGAEKSLGLIADALHQVGHHVEAFTTCTQSESNWSDHLPEGTGIVNGIPVHFFGVDRHDLARYQDAVRAILQADERVSEQVEREFLTHALHSAGLLKELGRRAAEFDAIITGPYLVGLSWDVARAFPERTLLVPCFHDEAMARLRTWLSAYEPVGGILYHSPEEQQLAECELGLNSPGGRCIGTFLAPSAGCEERGRKQVGSGRPYLLYCGRYIAQKGLPLLLDYARRYAQDHPARFTFAFTGEGEISIPDDPCFQDLGFVAQDVLRDLLAGAAGLVQLSRCESLSLATLEAWAQGTPVLVDSRCEVLVGQLRRSGGGQAVDAYETFAAALDDLWAHPETWHERGRQGQCYVRTQYGSRDAFVTRLEEAIDGLRRPLAQRMRASGVDRALEFSRPVWRERFAALVETLLDAPPRVVHEQVEVQARSERRTVAAREGQVLVAVRVVNRGTHPVLSEGPSAMVLRARVVAEDEADADCSRSLSGPPTPLPALLIPGQSLTAAVPVVVPPTPGAYRIFFRAERANAPPFPWPRSAALHLVVEENAPAQRCCAPLLETLQAALVEAQRLQRLPDTYTDVSQGLFASWKRWIKRKLVGNFQHAYVDVLSRQQSQVNQRLVAAVNELAECCALLEALPDRAGRDPASSSEPVGLPQRVAFLEARLAELEQRLAETNQLASARQP